jgi:hypothetical protein
MGRKNFLMQQRRQWPIISANLRHFSLSARRECGLSSMLSKILSNSACRSPDKLLYVKYTYSMDSRPLKLLLFLSTIDLGGVQPMIPTFVFGWPTGKETGDYLALDLGGTNLRVCLVTVSGEGKFELTQTKYRLTEEQKQEDGSKLFDFCAECVAGFIQAHIGEGDGLIREGQELALGFTVRIIGRWVVLIF